MALNNKQGGIIEEIPIEAKIASSYLTLTGRDYNIDTPVIIDDLKELLNKKPESYSEELDLKEFKKLVKRFLQKYEVPEDKVKSIKISFLPEGILTQLTLTEPILINNKPVTIILINRRKNVISKNAIIEDTTLKIFDRLDGGVEDGKVDNIP